MESADIHPMAKLVGSNLTVAEIERLKVKLNMPLERRKENER